MTLTPNSIRETLETYGEVLILVGQFISNQATFNPERANWKHFYSNWNVYYENDWLRVEERSDNQDDQLESISFPVSELLGDWNLINTAAIDRQATKIEESHEEYQVYLRLKAKFEPQV